VRASVTELPFNTFLGIQIGHDPAHLLRLPSGSHYLNHLDTVHASAQLALAEDPAVNFYSDISVALMASSRSCVVEAKFRKPANGSIISTASAAPESLAQLDAELSSKGRSLIPITVELHDESGVHTLSATFEWFIQRNKTPGPKKAGA